MGLTFLSENERNPVNQLPPQPPVNPCEAIQAELDEVNQFIDENNLLKNFYLWRQVKEEFENTKAEVIDELTLGDVASLEDEV